MDEEDIGSAMAMQVSVDDGTDFFAGDAEEEIEASCRQLFSARRGQHVIAAATAANINSEPLDFLIER